MTVDPRTNTVPVTLAVDGQRLEGFARGSIFVSMMDAYGTYSLEYTTELGAPAVRPGQLASVSVNVVVVIASYVDEAQYSDTPDELRYSILGRSLTQELVDSTTDRKAFAGRKLRDIVQALVAPFDIRVDEGASLLGEEPIAAFRTQKGETVFDAIQRACTLQKYFAYATGDALSVRNVDDAETLTTHLVRGKNVVSTSRTVSMANRYSDYLFATQVKSTDGNKGAQATQLRSEVRDEEVAAVRYRPIHVTVDASEKLTLRQKAEWERDRRIAAADTLEVQVVGFDTGDARFPVWQPGLCVVYEANAAIGLTTDTRYLITGVRFEFAAEVPQLATLLLVRPDSLGG